MMLAELDADGTPHPFGVPVGWTLAAFCAHLQQVYAAQGRTTRVVIGPWAPWRRDEDALYTHFLALSLAVGTPLVYAQQALDLAG